MASQTFKRLDAVFGYWDLRPREIVEPYNATPKNVPVAITGDPGGEVVFSSTHPGVARVEDGSLFYGINPGAAIITAEVVVDDAVVSRRYMQVDVCKSAAQTFPTLVPQWQASGYVEETPGGAWHFRYFDEWFDDQGGNIRVTGELSADVDLDHNYTLVFEVWGQIENVLSYSNDTLEVLVNDEVQRRLNPDWDNYGDPSLPYTIDRDVVRVPLSSYTGEQVTIRFVWDTQDEFLQCFDGWFVDKLRLEPEGDR